MSCLVILQYLYVCYCIHIGISHNPSGRRETGQRIGENGEPVAEEFQKRLEEAQRRLFDETVKAVAQAGPAAVDILLQVARHTVAKDSDRVRAAKAILDTVVS